MPSTQVWRASGHSGDWIDFGALIEARIWILSSNSTLDGSPLYASATWSAGEAESTLPTWYISVPKVMQSGEEITFRLRLLLGIAKYGHYIAHVEVAMDYHRLEDTYIEHQAVGRHQYIYADAAIVHYDRERYAHAEVATDNGMLNTHAVSRRNLVSRYGNAPLRIPEPHPDFKFTLLGSDKRALEVQGYSVNLESPGANVSKDSHPHPHSLIISDANSTFTISIKYFHTCYTCPGERFPQFIVVACVTMELVPAHGSQRYQDGPYVLRWADYYAWHWNSTQSPIYLTTPTGDMLALNLDLDRAWVSEYYLVVDLARHGDSHSQPEAGGYFPTQLQVRLVDPHDHVSLILPTHIRRDLQAHGYEVHFEGSRDNPYRLTLSDANLTIHIEYSYDLSTGSVSQPGLTFQAYVTISAPESSQDGAAQRRGQIVDWDAWHQGTRWDNARGWRWKLHDKDVKFALPNELQLTLRLSLYLLWLSEYCITVEVNPPKPYLQTSFEIPSRKDSEEDTSEDADSDTQENAEGETDE